MRVVVFSHSLVSDWNHGNAHFLRGVATELQERGHEVGVFEPADGSRTTVRIPCEDGTAPVEITVVREGSTLRAETSDASLPWGIEVAGGPSARAAAGTAVLALTLSDARG